MQRVPPRGAYAGGVLFDAEEKGSAQKAPRVARIRVPQKGLADKVSQRYLSRLSRLDVEGGYKRNRQYLMYTWSVNDSDGATMEDSSLSLAVGSHRPCTALGLECTPPCNNERSCKTTLKTPSQRKNMHSYHQLLAHQVTRRHQSTVRIIWVVGAQDTTCCVVLHC